MKTTAFLLADSRALTPEEIAAREFYRSRFGRTAIVAGFQTLPSLLKRTPPAVLWWHFDASTGLPSIVRDREVIAALLSYVRQGGGLLLSLLATPYVTELGVEAHPPDVIVKGGWEEKCWAPGTQDIRGFATVRGHPVFDGLGNGAYTWCPAPGDPFAAAWYEQQPLPTTGLVVAVERQYIRIDERRRIMLEYRVGKGRILTVGSHFFFAQNRSRVRPHLERLLVNALAYCASRPVPPRGSYWSVGQHPPEETARHSAPVRTSDAPLPAVVPPPGMTRRPATANEFDVGGRRILVLGEERRGIEEVWVHPCRILRDFQLTFTVGNRRPQRARDVVDAVTLYPGLIVRSHRCDGALIEESIFADRTLPAGAIRYRIESTLPVTIAIGVRVDLRVMWPLLASAAGTLRYGWDDGLQALRVSGVVAGGVSLIGSGRTPGTQRVRVNEGDLKEIVLELDYILRPGDAPLTVAFAGGGDREATGAYRRILGAPARRLNLQVRHGKQILDAATVLEGPDPQFNEAFRTALLSLDRFFVNVPGLGTSLMAGYASTAHGWNGGHEVNGRPGYAWFFGRDSVWTSFALLGCGRCDTVRDVLAFLGDHQDLTGKILHEMTTSGFAHFDAADATPLYIVLMGRYLAATGDTKFVRSQYSRLRQALAFCRSTDTDGDHLIENTGVGHGWIEGGKLFPVHTELYLAACWGEALLQAAYVARHVGDAASARRCEKESRAVAKALQTTFWNEKNRVYSFGKRTDGSFRTDETVLQAVPILFGMTERSKEDHVLDRFASEQFSADWGIRMVPKESPLYDPAGYHEGSIWPLCTGWASLAEFKTRRPVQGYMHAMSNLHLAWHWSAGNYPEVLHGERCVPAGVCGHQAWSASMALQPLIEGLLGFRPDVPGRRIKLRPYFPPEWERAEVRGLRVGPVTVAMTMRRRANKTSFIFSAAPARPVLIEFRPWLPCGTTIHAIRVGKEVALRDTHVNTPDDVPPLSITLRGEVRVTFEHTGGVAVVPPVAPYSPGSGSSGLRFIHDRWEKGMYEFVLEGLGGIEYTLDLVTGGTLRTIENARIVREDGERVTLGIRFDGSEFGGRKSVRSRWEF